MLGSSNLSQEISGNFLCLKSAPLCPLARARRPKEKSAGAKEGGALFLGRYYAPVSGVPKLPKVFSK